MKLVINEMPTAGSAILTNTDGASPPAYIVGVRGDESTIYDGRDGRLLCEIDWVNDCIYVDEKSVPVSDFLQPSPGGSGMTMHFRGRKYLWEIRGRDLVLRLALNNVSETIMLARYHQRFGPAAILSKKEFLEITPCGANMAGIIIASFWILKQANGLKKLPSELRAPPSPPWVHAQPVWSEKNAVSSRRTLPQDHQHPTIMKGISKAFARTPHLMTSRIGMSKKSSDPVFDDLNRKFTSIEQSTDKLLKDAKVFSDSVIALLTSGANFATHFSNLFHPIAGEYDLIGRHPEAEDTVRNVTAYQADMEELRQTLSPELELIESRIVGPVKELQTIMKGIRKGITKRDHKLLDYDRHNNSLTKLREKKEKTLNDEKNLFKLEQDFEMAVNEYEMINNAMKADLPRFMIMATQFIDPLFHSFFYMQLNIFYLMLEKLQQFASGKYETNGTVADIENSYHSRTTDAIERIEALTITKRMVSTAKMVQTNRLASGGSGTLSAGGSVRRAPSTASTMSSLAGKKAPPPPPGAASSSAAPPPYTPPAPNSNVAVIGKKAPPPPPPLKPKPSSAPPVQYVVALYDFVAQADGDLSFRVGDRIEVVERTASSEDWWTGRLNGQQGVFPAGSEAAAFLHYPDRTEIVLEKMLQLNGSERLDGGGCRHVDSARLLQSTIASMKGTPFLCGLAEHFPRPFSDPRHSLTYTRPSPPLAHIHPPIDADKDESALGVLLFLDEGELTSSSRRGLNLTYAGTTASIMSVPVTSQVPTAPVTSAIASTSIVPTTTSRPSTRRHRTTTITSASSVFPTVVPYDPAEERQADSHRTNKILIGIFTGFGVILLGLVAFQLFRCYKRRYKNKDTPLPPPRETGLGYHSRAVSMYKESPSDFSRPPSMMMRHGSGSNLISPSLRSNTPSTDIKVDEVGRRSSDPSRAPGREDSPDNSLTGSALVPNDDELGRRRSPLGSRSQSPSNLSVPRPPSQAQVRLDSQARMARPNSVMLNQRTSHLGAPNPGNRNSTYDPSRRSSYYASGNRGAPHSPHARDRVGLMMPQPLAPELFNYALSGRHDMGLDFAQGSSWGSRGNLASGSEQDHNQTLAPPRVARPDSWVGNSHSSTPSLTDSPVKSDAPLPPPKESSLSRGRDRASRTEVSHS
ncbi:BAR protein, partial [Rhizoctonia solani]